MAIVSKYHLQQIFTAHGLGAVEKIVYPQRGSVNMIALVNDRYAVRIDQRDAEPCRFIGEKIACEALAAQGLPVPQVIVLDTSRRLYPHNYMIVTCLAGTPVIDSWDSLTTSQRQQVATEAGIYLAQMHGVVVAHYGALYAGDSARYQTVFDYAQDFYAHNSVGARLYGVTNAQHQQILQLIRSSYGFFDPTQPPRLVHNDFHWENILQEDGHITGLLDFEWATGSDPTWEFATEDRWELMCVESRDDVMRGYASVRRLDPCHAEKVRLFKVLMTIETIANASNWRPWALGQLVQLLESAATPA